MRILVTSDLHGSKEAYSEFKTICIDEKLNLGIIAGDLTTFSKNKIQEEEKLQCILNSIGIPILFIMGNDDEYEWIDRENLHNINQKSYEYGEFRFIGYQYSNPFIGGKFEKKEFEQKMDFIELEKICTDKFILISHGPAFGILDNIDNKNAGSKALLEFLYKTKPEYHFFGHIHEQAGIFQNDVNVNDKHILSINVSYPIKKEFYLLDTRDCTIEIWK